MEGWTFRLGRGQTQERNLIRKAGFGTLTFGRFIRKEGGIWFGGLEGRERELGKGSSLVIREGKEGTLVSNLTHLEGKFWGLLLGFFGNLGGLGNFSHQKGGKALTLKEGFTPKGG